MTFNDLSREARAFAVGSFGGDGGGDPCPARVAHRAITCLAQRLLQVARLGLYGSVTVKVTFVEGELKKVFIHTDEEAQDVVAFNQ